MRNLSKITFLALTLGCLYSCSPQKTEEVTEEISVVEDAKTPSLTLVGETEESLITNESVLYDAETGTIYVSNIEGTPTEKDGKGSISIIDKEGNVITQDFVTGLDAPKGMGITNGNLYVTDIEELVEIDIASASIKNRYPVEGADFLNDVDTHDGKVYFTDMNTGKVHMLDGGEVSTISEGHESINGIAVADDGTIYGLDASGLIKWNADGTTSIVNSEVTGGDGLVILGDGNFIASRWMGEIWFVTEGGQTLMLDTKAEESNTADIGFIPEENLVLVPTFFKNKVAMYQIDY